MPLFHFLDGRFAYFKKSVIKISIILQHNINTSWLNENKPNSIDIKSDCRAGNRALFEDYPYKMYFNLIRIVSQWFWYNNK